MTQYFKVVLEGYRRCPDSHDLSECHHQPKSYPYYKFNSVNFDSEKLSVETLWDHLNHSSVARHKFVHLLHSMDHKGHPLCQFVTVQKWIMKKLEMHGESITEFEWYDSLVFKDVLHTYQSLSIYV